MHHASIRSTSFSVSVPVGPLQTGEVCTEEHATAAGAILFARSPP